MSTTEEQFFRATTPDGRQTVDVRLVDKENGLVEFWCRVVLDNNWTNPMEEFKTHSQNKLVRWMNTQMTQMMRRSKT